MRKVEANEEAYHEVKANACTARLTFEFGLLRNHRYSKFEYRKFLDTEATLPGLRCWGKLMVFETSQFRSKELSNMERIIDFLAEEEKQQAKREASKSASQSCLPTSK